jgi:predicted DNA-binding transcriptional regulator AlpA
MSKEIDVKELLASQNIDVDKQGFGALENLNILPLLFQQFVELTKKVENLEDQLIPKLDLTKRKDVKKFLDISDSTIYVMMNDGRFKEGIHFTQSIKNKKNTIVFIESAIKGYKENRK